MLAETAELDAATSDAAYYLMPLLNEELKNTASAAGWPKELVAGLFIDFDGSDLTVSYPEAMAQQIEDLEYGTGSNLPNSVIRSFSYRIDDIIRSVFENQTFDTLFMLEDVL